MQQDGEVICFEPGIVRREGNTNRFSKEVCSTLRADMGDNQPAVLCAETFHCTTSDDGTAMTLKARDYKDPLVVCSTFTKDAHPQTAEGGQGFVQTDVAKTLNVFSLPSSEMRAEEVVCYGLDAVESNSMKSANPHSGVHRMNIAKTLDTSSQNPARHQGGLLIVENNCVICRATQQANAEVCANLCPTITSAAGTSGNNQPIVMGFDAFNNAPTGNVSKTMTAAATDYHHIPCVYGDADAVSINCQGGAGIGIQNEMTETITRAANSSGNNLMAVKEGYVCFDNQTRAREPKECGDCSCTLQAAMGTGGNNTPIVTGEVRQSLVRRLTPLECERLMGFPDGHTMIPWKGKPAEECPDAPRYKACGNSMCVNVMRWIGTRIQKAIQPACESGRLWDESGVNPTLNQCNANSGIIGYSDQELFSQNANGLIMERWNGEEKK